MSNCDCCELNSFTSRRRRRRCASAQNTVSAPNEVYACVYSGRKEETEVTLPYEKVPICFDKSAMLENMINNHETKVLKPCIDGDYRIDFVLFIYSEFSAPCNFIIEANEKPLVGGTFTCTTQRGHQVCVGGTIASLNKNDEIRLVFTAPSAMRITAASATLCASKLN